MKWIVLTVILLAGCSQNICIENLNLGSDNAIDFDTAKEVKRLPIAVDKTLSHNGEMHALTIYADGNATYYVRFTPLHFSGERMYGPFEGNPRSAIECNE